MNLIKNRAELTAVGNAELRGTALDIAEKSVAFANPGNAVKRMVRLVGRELVIGDKRLDLAQGRVFVIGAGKASFPIAKALEDVLGEHLHRGLVVCKQGEEGRLERIEMMQASHPLPDGSSLEAAGRTVDLLRTVRAGDICPRRSNFDPPCRLNFDPGLGAGFA